MNPLNTLRRLRLAHLLLGMMFFYGIEQLFLDHYLHNPAARGYVTIVYAAALVLFDVPAGMLADRFGRKPCLLAAALVQILSLVILGASQSLGLYLLGSVLFGLNISLFNGASQAYLYDWLAGQAAATRYAQLQGGMYAWWLVGAGLANALSGVLVVHGGLRSAYFLSVIPGALALPLLVSLPEARKPTEPATIWYAHLGEAWREIKGNWHLINFALQFVASGVVLLTIGEFGQIYLLSFSISSVTLGVYWAITAASAAGGRALAHHVQRRPRLVIATYCAVLAAFALTQRALGIGLFWLLYGLNEALSNVAETEIQDSASSHSRATLLSLVSFIGNAVAIPVILWFTGYYQAHGIKAANQLVGVAAIALLLITLLVRPRRGRTTAPVTSQPGLEKIG